MATQSVAPAASPQPIASAVNADEWASEPTKLEDLTGKYELEAKIPGRRAGTSLFVVKATDRAGNIGQVVPEQALKMFLAPWQMMWLS